MTTSPAKTISEHKPVMVSEVVSNLITDPNGIYIDGTVGLGGHAKEVLQLLNKDGHLIGIDRDEEALKIAELKLKQFNPQYTLFNKSYSESDIILNESGHRNVSGILLDLGLSSAQLNDRERGFTYTGDGSLDMRFDQNSGITAAELLSTTSEEEIANIIWEFGEERYSRKIAYNIKRSPSMHTVGDLCEAIRKSTPPNKRNRSFARVFQSLRIAANEELNHLKIFLEKLLNLLSIGGRIVIISYHSLEDRMVKLAFKQFKADNQFSILTKKPLIASQEEVVLNSRAKSAKMRVGERIS